MLIYTRGPTIKGNIYLSGIKLDNCQCTDEPVAELTITVEGVK